MLKLMFASGLPISQSTAHYFCTTYSGNMQAAHTLLCTSQPLEPSMPKNPACPVDCTGVKQTYMAQFSKLFLHMFIEATKRRATKFSINDYSEGNKDLKAFRPLTCLTCSPWLQILSNKSQSVAISVFSSRPVMLASPCPSSTASWPIFSTSIRFVCKGQRICKGHQIMEFSDQLI